MSHATPAGERRAHPRSASDRWQTAITSIEQNAILIRGYALDEMMGRVSFADAVYLLLMGELPTPSIGRMLNDVPESTGETAAAMLSRYRLRYPGFEDQVALLFARGSSSKDIKRRLEVLYNVAVPDELIVGHAQSRGLQRDAHVAIGEHDRRRRSACERSKACIGERHRRLARGVIGHGPTER